jgi:hypothetical protein
MITIKQLVSTTLLAAALLVNRSGASFAQDAVTQNDATQQAAKVYLPLAVDPDGVTSTTSAPVTTGQQATGYNEADYQSSAQGAVQAAAAPSCTVSYISNNFTSNRGYAMPNNRLQVAIWYDGTYNPDLTVKVQYHDSAGNTGLITIGGTAAGGVLQPYGIKINTREYDLGGCEVSGIIGVSGVLPNGVIDGVAAGMYHRNASGRHQLLQSKGLVTNTASDFVGAWPIQLDDNNFRTWTPDIGPSTFEVARFQARMAIVGAQYVQDGWAVVN